MYQELEQIKLTSNDTQIIWRYMDFTKFLSLMQYSALFFCTCSQMKIMDPFEGDYPKRNLQNLQSKKEIIKLPKEFNKKPGIYRKQFLDNTTINCWHFNNSENAAMWKVYLSSKDGIAIKTTIKNLKESFANNSEDHIYIGNIHYNDYEFHSVNMDYNNYLRDVIKLAEKEKAKTITSSDILNKLAKYYYPLIMSKRKEFEYGKEIRLVSPVKQETKKNRLKDAGKLVKTDLQVLIDEVIISPNSQSWFVDLVMETMKSYGLLNKKVYRSRIYEKFE